MGKQYAIYLYFIVRYHENANNIDLKIEIKGYIGLHLYLSQDCGITSL